MTDIDRSCQKYLAQASELGIYSRSDCPAHDEEVEEVAEMSLSLEEASGMVSLREL